jgi:hypothetical protein
VPEIIIPEENVYRLRCHWCDARCALASHPDGHGKNQLTAGVIDMQYHLIEFKTKQLSRANNQYQLGVSDNPEHRLA